MFISTALLAIAFALGTAGASIEASRSVDPIPDICGSAHLVNTQTINVDGHVIEHNTFQCPDANLSNATLPLASALDASVVNKRSAGECRTTAPECQCGQAVTVACQNLVPGGAPTGQDCPILLDGLQIIAEQAGPSFLTIGGQVEQLSFGSCTVAFINNVATTVEYCWDDMRTNAGRAFQCIEASQSTGGQVNVKSGMWNIQVMSSM